MSTRHPSYRYHKARKCAVVTINGHDHYLGVFESPESLEKYHRLVAEWLAGRRAPSSPVKSAALPITIAKLLLVYWKFVTGYYVKDGRPTSEQDTIRHACRFVRKLYSSTPALEFSPIKLKAVRQAMIEHKITRKYKTRNVDTGEVMIEERILRHGLARKLINKHISRIKRMFAWAVEEELLPVEVHAALDRVQGLRKGKSSAREKGRIKPVPMKQVEAVLPLVPLTVRAMIEVQCLCGGRPQDIVEMRAAEIDRSSSTWEYHPRRFKTEHHNQEDDPERDRVVFLGPKAQLILAPFLSQDEEAYLFSPVLSEQVRNKERREKRKSPMTPSQAKRQAKGRTRTPLRHRYDVASYRRAIRRACLKAGIPIWHPNQLRHTRLTEIRKQYGLEASRVCGGHREVGVTQHYAEQDHDVARKVMAEIG